MFAVQQAGLQGRELQKSPNLSRVLDHDRVLGFVIAVRVLEVLGAPSKGAFSFLGSGCELLIVRRSRIDPFVDLTRKPSDSPRADFAGLRKFALGNQLIKRRLGANAGASLYGRNPEYEGARVVHMGSFGVGYLTYGDTTMSPSHQPIKSTHATNERELVKRALIIATPTPARLYCSFTRRRYARQRA
jgi:hypothetical protein